MRHLHRVLRPRIAVRGLITAALATMHATAPALPDNKGGGPTTSLVEIRTETHLPWPCLVVEERYALIHLDLNEVVADAHRERANDGTEASRLLYLQQRRAAALLAKTTGTRRQGCAWANWRELGDAVYYVFQRVAQGRATIVDQPSGAILPSVTLVRLDRYNSGEYENRFFRLLDGKPMLALAPTIELAPPRPSSRPDSGVAGTQAP